MQPTTYIFLNHRRVYYRTFITYFGLLGHLQKYHSKTTRISSILTLCRLTTHIYINRVFTKEWCVFKNLLNDYILQLDGAPIFTGMYRSYSIMFSNNAGSDVLQMETTTYTYYRGRIRLSCGCVSCDPRCTH
jgi:hypothetical protein